MKIYVLRHQAVGFLSQYPFAQPPTDAQKAAVEQVCVHACGTHHKKTGEPLWLRVEELELLGPEDVPMVPQPALTAVAAGGLGDFKVEGVGHVKNPK